MFSTCSAQHDNNWRRLTHPLQIFSIALVVSAVPVAALQQEIDSAAAKLTERLTKAGKKSVAVVDFTDLQGNVTELGRFLAEQLSVALEGTAPSFAVIDRTHLKAILQEHKLSASGLIDPQTARKLGQVAGVETLATGTITPFGDSVNLTIKAIDTETARLVGSVNIDIARTKAIDELLGRGLTTTSTMASSGQQASTASTPAPATLPRKPITATAGEILFSIRSCQRSGSKVVCRVSLTNTSTEQEGFSFHGSNTSYFVDDQGNQGKVLNDFDWHTNGEAEAKFGNGTSQSGLAPGVPVNLVLSKIEVPAEARSLSLVLGFNGNSGRDELVSLTNVPIE